jgi:ketosteroid isomerase-like protein
MSQETFEIARRSFEAFNRTFSEGTPDLYEMLDPEVEWVPMSALLEGTAYHGHDGVRRWLEDMKRDWITYEIRPERYLDLGDDRVLTWARGVRGDDRFRRGAVTGWSTPQTLASRPERASAEGH